MPEYDYLTLSPHEFENISRDLLQKKLSLFIESFTTGKDSGIDLRCSKNTMGNVIIQAKRYKDFTTLYNHLKLEKDKVSKLSPTRYIVTTSVGLTPANKDSIKNLFSPYILDTADILGKDDLNNLLGLYGDVELKYYKLWLASTNILTKVLHSKIFNQSAFELEETRAQIKLYVQNESFNEALKILNNHRYVIISGIPGIGKTTLARILILYLLSNDFEEFVYLNQSIDDGYEYFSEEKKQVFFFDDFLGKNFFENKQGLNEDNRIVKFIEKVKKSPNKILILATREYILNQAKVAFEAFKIHNIEIAKCVLDLSSYTNIIKAQIIYNHLFFANIPPEYLIDVIEKDNHTQLVHHRNYNPRIIETVINRKIWEHCSANQFASAFISYFDNPESVWLYSFENSLDKFSQYVLLVLLTMGGSVLVDDLEAALKEFLTLNNYKFFISYDSIKFNKAIRELENTFIKTQKDSYANILINYQNPSIQDFLVNYLRDKKDLIESLLLTSVFSDQFFSIFTSTQIERENNKHKVVISEALAHISVFRLISIYPSLKSCHVLRYVYSNGSYEWGTDTNFKYEFLYKIYYEVGKISVEAHEFVYKKFQEYIYIDDYNYSEQKAYLNLLNELDRKKLVYSEEKIIDWYLDKTDWIDNLELFTEFKTIFPVTFSEIVQQESFATKVKKLVKSEMSSVKDSDLYSLKAQIENIQDEYEFLFEEEINELNKREKAYDDYVDTQAINHFEDKVGDSDMNRKLSEAEIIEEIFNSLKS